MVLSQEILKKIHCLRSHQLAWVFLLVFDSEGFLKKNPQLFPLFLVHDGLQAPTILLAFAGLAPICQGLSCAGELQTGHSTPDVVVLQWLSLGQQPDTHSDAHSQPQLKKTKGDNKID